MSTFLSSDFEMPNSTTSTAPDDVELPGVAFWFKLILLFCDVDEGWTEEVMAGDCGLLIFDDGPDVEARKSEFLSSCISRDGLWIVDVSDVDVPDVDCWMELSEWFCEVSPLLVGTWGSSTSTVSKSY